MLQSHIVFAGVVIDANKVKVSGPNLIHEIIATFDLTGEKIFKHLSIESPSKILVKTFGNHD